MRIKHLSLENFRGFEKLEIEFPEKGSAVFIGVNGAGKTSILNSCAVLLEVFYSRLSETIPVIGLSQWDINLNAVRTLLDSLIIIEGNKIEIHAEYKRRIADIEDTGIKDIRGRFFEQLKNRVQSKMGNLNIPFFMFYSTNRFIPDFPKLEAENVSNIYPFTGLFNPSVKDMNFVGFFRWFRGMEDLENEKRVREDSNYRNRDLQSIRKAIQALMPGFSRPFVKRQPNEEFVVEKNGEQFSISQLSHGEKGVMVMVGDLARRLSIANPELEDPLLGFGIVLIDEIELHLHPAWQRSIIPTLEATFPNIQFIATTHSPQVLSSLKQENVFVLEEFKLVEKTPHTFGRDSNSLLQDLFNVAERPEKTKDEFRHLYRLIDDPGKIVEANDMLEEMEEKYGRDDPEIIRARMHLEFMNDE
ncbi:MAG: AAA family ATPase [Lewinellaceae bacterium]|nr:AAA family ATPase [Phaeodactylibacter sp.]MCB9035238.1 AAA family ATPase [Lewinellaceae bacterium]